MLLVVRPEDTPASLDARRRALSDEVAALAAAPVRHVPTQFLQAVEGLFPELIRPRPPHRRAAR